MQNVHRLIAWPSPRLTAKERLTIFFMSLRLVLAGKWESMTPLFRAFATDNANYVMRSSSLEPIRLRLLAPLLLELRLVTSLRERTLTYGAVSQLSVASMIPAASPVLPIQLHFFSELVTSAPGGPTQVRPSSIFDVILTRARSPLTFYGSDPGSHPTTRFHDRHGALEPTPIMYWAEAARFRFSDRTSVTGTERRGNLVTFLCVPAALRAADECDEDESYEFDDFFDATDVVWTPSIYGESFHARLNRAAGNRVRRLGGSYGYHDRLLHWDDVSSTQ